VTDASVAVQAECVMLNKGPFIARAVRVLDDILRRMERHQYKKRQLYRRLAVSTRALSPTGE
jgi:pyruvate kinase